MGLFTLDCVGQEEETIFFVVFMFFYLVLLLNPMQSLQKAGQVAGLWSGFMSVMGSLARVPEFRNNGIMEMSAFL